MSIEDGIECPYKDKCTGYSAKCNSCKNNTGKRDYYIPAWEPYTPQPYYPLFPGPGDPLNLPYIITCHN